MKKKGKDIFKVIDTTYEARYLDFDKEKIEGCGLCSPATKVMLINTCQSKDDITKTLLHELTHAGTFESGLIQTSVSDDVWEMVCEMVSKIISDNFYLRRKPKKK